MQASRAEAAAPPPITGQAQAQPGPGPASGPGGQTPDVTTPTTFVRDGEKVGRNEPCPCGSGKKYKQCHGKVA